MSTTDVVRNALIKKILENAESFDKVPVEEVETEENSEPDYINQ